MPAQPKLERFAELTKSYDIVPVYRRLLSDTLTPVSAFRLVDDGGSAVLFESVIGGEKVGRFSFIAVGAQSRIAATRDQLTTTSVSADGTVRTDVQQVRDPLQSLWQTVSGKRVAKLPELPPFSGGAFGYASYDVVRYVEDLPNAPPDDRQLPDLDFSMFDDLILFDHVTKSLFVVAHVHCDRYATSTEAYEAGQRRINAITERLQQPLPSMSLADFESEANPQLVPKSNFSKAEFEKAVEHCVEYIRAGDIFQVVIGQRLELPNLCDPFEVYRTLRVVNPSPFMFFVRTPAVTLVGSSPEIMCRVIDGVTTVRPLAGTRPRGKTEKEDRELAEELLADPKERAEHVMLVDLGRNDVGRVAEYGSIELTDVMVVERYSHVMHISSSVHGKLRQGLNAMDALKACLPAGTVSGAPKVRAMEVIDEVEPHRRGPYAGAVGYIDYAGNMDTCIALRTIVFCNDKIYVQAGAGIVADSVPATEYQETLNKAGAMLKAIEATVARK
jgi:anthranilate synthase component I